MKHTKIITWILALALLLPCLPMAGHAADEFGFSVAVSPEAVPIGGQTVVTVSLDDYDTETIAGLQVDIAGIDPNVLTVVDKASVIEDTEAMSNKASYNTSEKRVRLLYFWENETPLTPCEDVLKMTVRIDPNLTGAGSITLPVTVKIVTEDSRQFTLTSSCTIHYAQTDTAVFNAATGASYDTVGDALAAAGEGEKVLLMKDCSESLVVVPAGVTLDLNGRVVEAANVVSFGAVIDTAASAGGIRIDIDTTKAFTKLQPENGGYLPIYDTTCDQYKFYEYELKNAGAKVKEDSVLFGIQIIFSNAEAYTVLANTENSGVKLTTKLAWTGISVPYIGYEISNASMKTYAQKRAAAPDVNYAIILTLSGLENLSGGDCVKAAPAISTIAEVAAENAYIVHTVG